MQSKRDSHKEILVNNIVGVILGLIAMRIMIPILEGIDPGIQSVIIVFVMFCLSYTRGFCFRRYFNRRRG